MPGGGAARAMGLQGPLGPRAHGDPDAVFPREVASLVAAFEDRAGRAFAHLGPEGFEVVHPCGADGDTPGAEVLETRRGGVGAVGVDLLPGAVGRAVALPGAMAMDGQARGGHFPVKAAAARGLARAHSRAADHGGLPAVTLEQPMGMTAPGLDEGDAVEAAISLAGHVDPDLHARVPARRRSWLLYSTVYNARPDRQR
jgi:hypothetical protein